MTSDQKDLLECSQAYRAMVCFLEKMYKSTGSDDIGALLGEMMVLSDGCTADPAIFEEWKESLEEALDRKIDDDAIIVEG